MMICTVQEEVKMKISIERDLQIYTLSTDFQGALQSLTMQTNGGTRDPQEPINWCRFYHA
jgi:hypothetical protein